MSDFKNLILSSSGNILDIVINREKKLNALNQTTMTELKQVVQSLYEDTDVRGVILRGAGDKAFVAGADIAEFTKLNEMNARKFSEEGQEIFDLIENCHTPIIAIVNGFALGGGSELAMACHMRIATENAKFGQPEVNLGIIPGYGGTQRLTRLIGKGRAFEFMMSADMIDAKSALDWGLVNHVTGSQEEAMELANTILTKIGSKAPIAIELVVDCVNAVFNQDENGYQTEANAFAKCCATEDSKEGVLAFLEKRKADFTGS